MSTQTVLVHRKPQSLLGKWLKAINSWVQTGLVTGLLAFLIILGSIFLMGPKIGHLVGVIIVTLVTIFVSDFAVRSYVKTKKDGVVSLFEQKAANWARSLILPFIAEKLPDDGSGSWLQRTRLRVAAFADGALEPTAGGRSYVRPFARLTAFLAVSAMAAFSGAIITQGISLEIFGRSPKRWVTIWGAFLFGVKFAVLYGAVALAVHDGGSFWSNWWGAWT